MKKYKLLIIFIFTNILSFNAVYAECAFSDFEIGGDSSEAIELYGEPIENINAELEEDSISLYIEVDFKIICSEFGIEDGTVSIILLGDIIAGFLIEAFTKVDDPNIEEKLIYYYIIENHKDFVKKIEDPDWTGGAYWTTEENKFYYDKHIIGKKTIKEKLLITNSEMADYL